MNWTGIAREEASGTAKPVRIPPHVQKIGLFGGSFDPIHIGHLMIAEAALGSGRVEWIVFIPAGRSPLKDSGPFAPGCVRIRWVRMALAGWPRCSVDDREIRRGRISYTIETVREYRQEYPDAQLYWIIGSDLINDLPRWKEADALAELVDFLVVERPGSSPTRLPDRFRIERVPGVSVGISSTELRRRIRHGLPYRLWIPEPVASLIAESGYYKNNGSNHGEREERSNPTCQHQFA